MTDRADTIAMQVWQEASLDPVRNRALIAAALRSYADERLGRAIYSLSISADVEKGLEELGGPNAADAKCAHSCFTAAIEVIRSLKSAAGK